MKSEGRCLTLAVSVVEPLSAGAARAPRLHPNGTAASHPALLVSFSLSLSSLACRASHRFA